MSGNDSLKEMLEAAADWGEARGADAVWAAAEAEVAGSADPGDGADAPARGRPPRPRHERRVGPWLVAAAVALVVGGGAWWLTANRDRPATVNAVDGSAPNSGADERDDDGDGDRAGIEDGGTEDGGIDDAGPSLPVTSDRSRSGEDPEPGSAGGPGTDAGGTDPPDVEADDTATTVGVASGALELPLDPYGLGQVVDSGGSAATGWWVELEPGSEPGDSGGAAVSTGPHTFDDDRSGSGAGRLVIEVDYAAVVEDRGDASWGEVVVTTAPAMVDGPDADVYPATRFSGHHAIGCRLQFDRSVVCHRFDPSGERVWQLSWFESAAPVDESVWNPDPWTVCGAGVDPRTCLDRFRIELTANSVTVLVDGQVQIMQAGAPLVPAELVDGEVYVHAVSAYSRQAEPTARYDWGPLIVGGR